MHVKVLVAGAIAALAVAASPSAADVSPFPVSGPAIQVRPAGLAYDAAGRAVVSWSGLAGRLPDATHSFTHTAAAPAGGAWARGPRLPRTVIDHAVAVGRGPVAAIVTLRQAPVRHKRSRTSLVLSLWDTRSPELGRSVLLARGPLLRVGMEGPTPTIFSPRIGMTADDDVVVTWMTMDPVRRRGLWVATLRPDGRLVEPRRLARGMAGYPELRIAPDGSGLLVYARQRNIAARRRAPDGSWGPAERVGTAPDWVNQLESWRIAGSGERFVVAAVVSRRADGVRTQVLTETRTAGGHWYLAALGEYVFHTTAATSFVTGQLRAVPLIAADGRIRVVWPDMVDGRVRAALTELLPGGDGVIVGPPALLSGPATDVAIEDAAIRPDGAVAAVWFDVSAEGGTPTLAQADASGAVTVTPPLSSGRAVLGSRVAFDPLTGRPTVVWAQRDTGGLYRLVSWTAP
jgi:hypothetical protein